MRNLPLTFSLILSLAAAAIIPSAVFAQRPEVRWNAPPEEWHWNIPEPIAGVRHGTVKSRSMDREVGYNILLPPGYESAGARRYPVVYYLHGASGSELSAYELGDVVRRLREQEKIGDVIYVLPNGGHFSKYRDWKEGNVKAETWIIRELIPHIDAEYRTLSAREGRALAGWSMGGDAALRFVCKYPDSFCAAASMGAAIDWGEEDSSEDTIFAHSRKNVEQLRGRTGLLLVVGEEDRLARAHERLKPHLEELKLEYEFRSYPGIGHNLGAIKEKCAEELVQMLSRNLAEAK